MSKCSLVMSAMDAERLRRAILSSMSVPAELYRFLTEHYPLFRIFGKHLLGDFNIFADLS